MLEPSPQITALLSAAALQTDDEQLRALKDRQSEFPSPLQAQLAGIALDRRARDYADKILDDAWSDETRQQNILAPYNPGREVIIGSGFHAAVYAAVRVLTGHERPLVLEREPRAGGTFAMTAWPTFYLNSRNRAGRPGLAGDQRASLNYLPGGLIQAADLSMAEYQTNTDMAFVIRLTLAQFADVVTNARVTAVDTAGAGVEIYINGRSPLRAGRVIDARGLGDPDDKIPNGTTILTFDQFMRRMAGRWPLRGVRRVAVIGGGDSAKCAIESLLGIAPSPPLATAALDSVDAIDCYSDILPDLCERWQQEVRGRYQAIGRYLRPDRQGVRRLSVIPRRAQPVGLPGTALVDGRTYDLVVMCTGYQETVIDGLELLSFTAYQVADTDVAVEHDDIPAYRIGPHARLPFTSREYQDGIADITANAVSMFRTAGKTAALAATLPSTNQ